MNAKMSELKRAFELAGFADVKTVLGSGNVVFAARAGSDDALAHKAEASMAKHLPRSFFTLVRAIDELRELIDSDPFTKFALAPGSKRVVTFLAAPPSKKPKL